MLIHYSLSSFSLSFSLSCNFPSEQCELPRGDVDLVRDRPVQNSWIHNLWGYISLLIYWAVIRIQRWTKLEDIFKAAEEITGKPMRLVALLQHPWNPFSAPLQQCEMMSVKMGCLASPPAIYLIYSGISVKNKYSQLLQDLSQQTTAHEHEYCG